MTKEKLTIGRLARSTGLTPKTLRFYEDEGLLLAPRRSEAGYRLYDAADVVRARLVRQLRLLGLGLPTIKRLVEQAFAADCARFGADLTETVQRQLESVERQLKELQTLKTNLVALEEHVRHCCEDCDPAATAADCDFCFLMSDEEGGEKDGSNG